MTFKHKSFSEMSGKLFHIYIYIYIKSPLDKTANMVYTMYIRR